MTIIDELHGMSSDHLDAEILEERNGTQSTPSLLCIPRVLMQCRDVYLIQQRIAGTYMSACWTVCDHHQRVHCDVEIHPSEV